MRRRLAIGAFAFVSSALSAFGQKTVPLYTVTVIEHDLKAINYQYRSGPTEIDFRGTILLPKSKGHAVVESHRGRTEIEAKLQGLTSPQAYGTEYLTYVLWAISPEGAPRNLGELVSNASDDAHVHVTTDLQAFGLLVTAEPYAAVKQPGDVVVLENEIRPETIGKTEPIVIQAELLPRGHYVLDKQKSETLLNQPAPKVSMGEYEQMSQIYQAQNALALARTVNADKLAPETYAKAQQLLDDAKQKQASKAGTSFVVQSAREAAQTADDAREIALKRSQEDRVAKAERDAAEAKEAAKQARADANAARAQIDSERARADAEHAKAEAERAARSQIENSPAPEPPPPPPVPAAAPAPVRRVTQDLISPQTQFRARLLAQLKGAVDTLDTPRGLVIVLPDADFRGANLTEDPVIVLARVAGILGSTKLQITVEGNTDSSSTDSLAMSRAESVKDDLISAGLHANMVTARSLGNTRPTTSNSTEAGRLQNRRVEIVISGGQIGDSPLWNRSYSLSSR